MQGAVREWGRDEGYNDEPGAFVQTGGGRKTPDATGLLLPVVRFLSFDDERVRGTVRAVEEHLLEEELLVRRHDGDGGLPRDEGACWLVDALTLSGRIEEARDRLETLIEYIKPPGLVPEGIDGQSDGVLSVARSRGPDKKRVTGTATIENHLIDSYPSPVLCYL